MENWCISMGIYSYPILDSDAARKPKATRIISWSAAQHSSSPSYRWNRPKTPWRSISPPLGRSQRGVFPWWEQQTFSKPPRTMMVDDVFLKHQVPLIRAYQPSTFFRERKADTDNPRSVWCEQTWKKRGFLMFFCTCFVNKTMVEFDKTGSKHRNRICQPLPPDLAPRSYGNQGEVQHQSHIDASHRLPSNLISFSVNVPLFYIIFTSTSPFPSITANFPIMFSL